MNTAEAIALTRRHWRVRTGFTDQTYNTDEMVAMLRGQSAHLNPFATEDMIFEPTVKQRKLAAAGETLLSMLPAADGVLPVLIDPAIYVHIEDGTAHVDFGAEVLYALAAYRRNPAEIPLWLADVNPAFVRAPYWPEEQLGPYITADDLDAAATLDLFLRAELWIRQD